MPRMRNPILMMYIGAATVGLIRMTTTANLTVNTTGIHTTTANPVNLQDENGNNNYSEIQSTIGPAGRAIPAKPKSKPKAKTIDKSPNTPPPSSLINVMTAQPRKLTNPKNTTNSGSGVRKVLPRINRPSASSEEEDENITNQNQTKSKNQTENPVPSADPVTKTIHTWCKVCKRRTPKPKIVDEPEPEVVVLRSNDPEMTTPPAGRLNFKVGEANKRQNKTDGSSTKEATVKPSVSAEGVNKATIPPPVLTTTVNPETKIKAKESNSKPPVIPPNNSTPKTSINVNPKPMLTSPETTKHPQLSTAPPNPSKKLTTKSNISKPKTTKNPPPTTTTTQKITTRFVYDPTCAETGQDCAVTNRRCCQAPYDVCGTFFSNAPLTCGHDDPDYNKPIYDQVQERFAAEQTF